MVRRNILVAAALLLASLGLSGQSAPVPKESAVLPPPAPEERIFAPFPLRIRIGTRPDGVLLTWEEAADPTAGYSVFRSDSPIDRGSFPAAERLKDLPEGSLEYLDVPPDSRGYYYAVLGRTDQGGVYEVFIPLKNVSIAPVSYVPPAAPAPEPDPKPVEPAPEPPPAVRASSERDGIRVVWEPVRPGRRVVLYRSPSPIRSLSDLLTASWVASAEESPEGILDFPVPGIGYFYALVDDEGLRTGSPELAVGLNVTAESVSVPAGRFRIGLPDIPYASRSLPLPYLSLTRGVEAGSQSLPGNLPVPSPSASPLRPETQKAVSRLGGNGKNLPSSPPELRILPEDLESSAVGGEEYTLRTIVRDRLARKDWKGASDELARYLSLNRSPSAAARARFYRGQALAYSGQYREAFFEFLLAQDTLYGPANLWIDWLLDRMKASGPSGGM